MRKPTPSKTWKNCLRMWKWIAKVWKKDGPNVGKLKHKWLRAHGFKAVAIDANCFFCEYDYRHRTMENECCDNCPGIKVNRRFNCEAKSYNYYTKPMKFYEKLLQLDAKRKER